MRYEKPIVEILCINETNIIVTSTTPTGPLNKGSDTTDVGNFNDYFG